MAIGGRGSWFPACKLAGFLPAGIPVFSIIDPPLYWRFSFSGTHYLNCKANGHCSVLSGSPPLGTRRQSGYQRRLQPTEPIKQIPYLARSFVLQFGVGCTYGMHGSRFPTGVVNYSKLLSLAAANFSFSSTLARFFNGFPCPKTACSKGKSATFIIEARAKALSSLMVA